MAYDYNKLLGLIKEKFGNQKVFSKAMKMSEHSLSAKLNCKVAFKQTEITQACALLGINTVDMHLYFFIPKVHRQ